MHQNLSEAPVDGQTDSCHFNADLTRKFMWRPCRDVPVPSAAGDVRDNSLLRRRHAPNEVTVLAQARHPRYQCAPTDVTQKS
jgi:hypothetical protein